MIKKEYKQGDIVWIYGVGVSNKLTKGTVIASVDLSEKGYTDLQYIIQIPTHIEPLLEVRSWHSISQDDKGPVGSFRDMLQDLSGEVKKIKQLGFFPAEDQDLENDPTPEEIMAALEKSTNGLTHKPLHIKETKPKRKYYPRKKK